MDKFNKLYRVEQLVFVSFVLWAHLLERGDAAFESRHINEFPTFSSSYRRDLMDAVARLVGMGLISIDERGTYRLTKELRLFLASARLGELLGGIDESIPF